jgi:hypothetical protein
LAGVLGQGFLLSIKADLPVQKWSAQWQQQPTATESAIVKREWWKMWEKEDIPPLKYILQAYDTAFSKKETADYSAITTWGIFEPEEGGPDNIMLLDARRGRWMGPRHGHHREESHRRTTYGRASRAGHPCAWLFAR